MPVVGLLSAAREITVSNEAKGTEKFSKLFKSYFSDLTKPFIN
jgi:hypothetical protein